MRDQCYITPEECELWMPYPLVLTTNRTNYGDVAPYFVEMIRQDLSQRFGRDLYNKGLQIYTTLDLDMQEAAERALSTQLDAIDAGVYGKVAGHTTYREYIEANRPPEEHHGPSTPYPPGATPPIARCTGASQAMSGGRRV